VKTDGTRAVQRRKNRGAGRGVENEGAGATLLFLCSSLLAGPAALEVGGTAFTFDDFIELLAHG